MKLIVTLIAVALLAGCATPSTVALDALAVSNRLITEEYVFYVQADDELSETDKDVRVRAAEGQTSLIDSMRKGVTGE